ncbi:Hypothetical protein SRAE_X000163800 [Strongyloides ratti]|uniref:Uncharacterized protein n=1 Tax=Strongyloides ratti TaxID=34506 RepID=A0A090KVJ8_STRRB|nr:Hypothetical protein SRAE_X000163800 [Strongyloides ratti]CEF59895.1 Hypothetical protein SRAE_X000163800 [Strongyloides ratti]
MSLNPMKKFPLRYNVLSGKSDIVLVKCPNNNYKHNEIGDIFHSKKNYNFIPNSVVFKTLKTEWYGVSNYQSNSNITYFNCGTLELKILPNTTMNWNATITWAKDFNSSTYDRFLNVARKIYHWHNENQIFVRNKNRLVSNFYGKSKIDYYKNDKIYVFREPDFDKEFLIPDIIFVPVHIPPNIDIIVEENRIINIQHNILTKIIKNNESETFNIKLLIKGKDYSSLQFYKHEKVEVSIVNIHYNGTYIYSPYVLSLNNTVTIDYYGIIDVKYYCNMCLNTMFNVSKQNIIKTFYFGPIEKNHVKVLPDVITNSREYYHTQPSCPLNDYNFSRPYQMKFNGLSVLVEDILKNKTFTVGNFSLFNDTIFFTNKSYNGVLECVYITLDGGTFTTKVTFRGEIIFLTGEKKMNFIISLIINLTLLFIFIASVIAVTIGMIYLKRKKKRMIRKKQLKRYEEKMRDGKNVYTMDTESSYDKLKLLDDKTITSTT